MLKVKNLRKTYKMGKNKLTALDDVSFELPSGRLVAIVGPSGCGKTTMMNILGALDGDFEGEVLVDGKSLKEAAKKDLDSYRKNTVGFIFQQFNLLNSQTSLQNVEIALDLSGAPKKEKRERAGRLLKDVGIETQIKKKVNLLSGGQKQRVAIARALANDPEIILADEPTGALDFKTGKQVMDLLKEIAKTKLVLMVTHAPELAQEYADMIIKMEDGKIISIEENTPNEVETRNTDQELGELEEQALKEKTLEGQASGVKGYKSKSKMSYLTALKLSLRSAWLKKGRTIATAIGTSIGICGIALAIAITSGTSSVVKTQVKGIFPTNSLLVTIKGDKEGNALGDGKSKVITYKDIAQIMNLSNKFYAYTFVPQNKEIPMPAFYSMDEKIFKDPNFLKKASQREKGVQKKLIDTMTLGVAEDIKNDIQYGKLQPVASLNEITISLSTAKNILVTDKTIKNIKDLIGKNIYIGFVKRGGRFEGNISSGVNQTILLTRTFKIAGIANTTTMMNTIYAASDWNIKLYKKEFKVDPNTLYSSYLLIYAKDSKNLSSQVKKLNKSNNNYILSLAGKTISDQVDSAMAQVKWALLGFAGISILVAALMISIVIYISVLERTNEIGILRAVGARRRDIMNIFVAESFIIGVLSAIIGIGLSIGASEVINNLVYKYLQKFSSTAPYMEVAKLPMSDAGMIILFCVILSVISGLYPSRRAAKLDPIEALRRR